MIQAIDQFKQSHPAYTPTKYIFTSNGERIEFGPDGRQDSTDYWYHIRFYYPKEKQLVISWTRPTDRGTTQFAFVAINQGLNLGNWKDINNARSCGYFENRKLKRQFEERIVSKIKKLAYTQ